MDKSRIEEIRYLILSIGFVKNPASYLISVENYSYSNHINFDKYGIWITTDYINYYKNSVERRFDYIDDFEKFIKQEFVHFFREKKIDKLKEWMG